MGTIGKHPASVKLIAGIITSSDEAFALAEKALVKAFGSIDFKSQKMKFDYTDYYKKEMGGGLFRYFLSFKKLITAERLSNIKIHANRIEARIAKKIHIAKRPVNIDPGYIDAAKLVLASTKDYYHRIFIGKGIYAEITLFFQGGSFRALEWTYPDYRTREYLDALEEMRNIFLIQKRGKKDVF